MLCLVGAAHAYRGGDPRVVALAVEAHDWWSRSGESIARLLCGSLACAVGAPLDSAVRARLVDAAWRCAVPGVGIQCAALLHQGGERAPPEIELTRLESSAPTEH